MALKRTLILYREKEHVLSSKGKQLAFNGKSILFNRYLPLFFEKIRKSCWPSFGG